MNRLTPSDRSYLRSALNERIRISLARAVYYSGLFRLALWWKGRAGPYLVILSYDRYTHPLEYARELVIPITVFPVTGYVRKKRAAPIARRT